VYFVVFFIIGKIRKVLIPAHDIPQFMWHLIVNWFPTLEFTRTAGKRLGAEGYIFVRLSFSYNIMLLHMHFF